MTTTREDETSSADGRRRPRHRLDLRGPRRAGLLILALLLTGAYCTFVISPRFTTGAVAELELMTAQAYSVRHPFGGILARTAVREGQDVVAGDLIATFDAAQLDAQIKDLKAQSEAAARHIELVRREAQTFSDQREKLMAGRSTVAELEQKLAALELESMQLAKEIARAERQLAHIELRAPVSGKVTRLTAIEPGSTVSTDLPIALISPTPSRLVLEGRLPTSRADVAGEGRQSLIWLNALSWLDGPAAIARLTWVSNEPSVDAAGNPLATARFELETAHADLARHLAVLPGMRRAVLLADSSRTALEQLLEPIRRNFSHQPRTVFPE